MAEKKEDLQPNLCVGKPTKMSGNLKTNQKTRYQPKSIFQMTTYLTFARFSGVKGGI